MNFVQLFMTSLCLIVIFGVYEGAAASTRGSRGLLKRNGCTIALKTCRKDKNCSEALVNMKLKCAVKDGKCDAKMWDLPICSEIMETLTATSFELNNRCVCDKKNNDCSSIYSKLYDNPCFGSVRYLKSLNMLPRPEERVVKEKTKTENVEQKVEIKKDKFLENFMAYDADDVQHSSFTTSLNILNNDFFDEPAAEAINDDVTVDDVTNVNDDKMTPTNGSVHDDGLLLHVVAIATGILMLSMLILGATLLVYFNIRRKENKTEKNNSPS